MHIFIRNVLLPSVFPSDANIDTNAMTRATLIRIQWYLIFQNRFSCSYEVGNKILHKLCKKTKYLYLNRSRCYLFVVTLKKKLNANIYQLIQATRVHTLTTNILCRYLHIHNTIMSKLEFASLDDNIHSRAFIKRG